ncbi:Hpt domain-containing protein [Tabrizicola sp. J26]|uniref:Hpt domain-containing protein n=1 Tax=Alitabrizicola rongguiensis TaxID=2909234 RepID=UPI001F24B3DC|nr:Hpt domain-containing protein [Tabrizicola rongguiensis]MCF1708181.1 Hpt domain-containing protein [Tabrizicola rongguiensis]
MVDWGRVASLRMEIGAADFSEVLEMFLAEADDVIRRLRSGTNEASYEAELHALKGAALNLGLSDLANLCSEGERAARCGVAADISAIVSGYTASRAALLAGLASKFAA